MSKQSHELKLLEDYLQKHNYDYELFNISSSLQDRHQIIVYNTDKNGKRRRSWDAICQLGSYGYDRGLLEIYGDIVADNWGDTVIGWLTAKQVINIIEGRPWT